MTAITRPHNNNFVVPALGLAIMLAFVMALPNGATETVVTEHAKTKHEVGTLPASTIFDRISRGQYRLFYRAISDEYIALVEVNGQCGGARLARADVGGVRRWVQAFGGSECYAHLAGSCAYWWCCIEKGGYVPVAGVGG